MYKRKRMQAVIGAAAILTATAAAVAHAENEAQDSFSQAIDYRNSLMTVMRWNHKPMGDMLEGKRPFDKSRFSQHLRDLQSAVSMDLLAGFPEDSDEGEDTSAKAEIWMDWEDFEQKFKNLRRQTSKLSLTVRNSDRAAIEAQFAEVSKACKACHKKYKE